MCSLCHGLFYFCIVFFVLLLCFVFEHSLYKSIVLSSKKKKMLESLISKVIKETIVNSEYVLKTTGTGINHCQITFVE